MDSGPECESWIKAVTGDKGSGLVALHLKGMLTVQLFTISRNRLAPGGVVPPRSARP